MKNIKKMNLITYSKSLNLTKKLQYLVGGLFNRIAWRNKVFYAEENSRIILQMAEQMGFKTLIDENNFYFQRNGMRITARKNTSDPLVFRQIYLNQEYLNVVQLFQIVQLFQKGKNGLNTMIDAGSNVGYTSLYFSEQFPECKIVALEPFTSNFQIGKKNLVSQKNVTPLNCALWKQNAILYQQPDFRDGKEWAIQFGETKQRKNTEVNAVDVFELIKTYFNNSFIDFLKIDIEGGEFGVLNPSNNLSWLNKVKVLALEIHDECGDRNIIDSILTDHGFFIYRSGELTVALNLNQLLLDEK